MEGPSEMADTKPYQENEDHVPDPTDLDAQYLSAARDHARIEDTATVYTQDKVATAEQIKAHHEEGEFADIPRRDLSEAERLILPNSGTTQPNDQAPVEKNPAQVQARAELESVKDSDPGDPSARAGSKKSSSKSDDDTSVPAGTKAPVGGGNKSA